MRSETRKRRVLIVGAKFGEVYLDAFLQPLPGLELAGLLARGSRRARQLAHDFGIPLYTALEQVPDDVDIACVVVRSTVAQGEGSRLAEGCLRRGMHVVQEHPLHPDDVARLQALAQQHNRVYWVNSFYPNTPAGRCWIDAAGRVRHLLGGQAPVFAHLTASRQLLYSMLDMLLQACGLATGEVPRVERLAGGDDTFALLGIDLPGGCRALLHLQTYLNPDDPDMFSLVMQRASLGWPSGYLTLEASPGPVLWTGVFHDSGHGSDDRIMYRRAGSEADSSCYARPCTEVLHAAPANWRDAFELDAAAGIAHVLHVLSSVLDGNAAPPGFGAAHQMALAHFWLAALRAAPAVQERRLSPPVVLTRTDIMAARESAQPNNAASFAAAPRDAG